MHASILYKIHVVKMEDLKKVIFIFPSTDCYVGAEFK